MIYVIVNSQKFKGKALKEHIQKEVVPRGFNARIKEIQEGHQQFIANRDNQVEAIQYENVALQVQRDVYQAWLQGCQDQICDLIINRHVSRANDPGKYNIVMIFEKNTTPEEDEFDEYPSILREYNNDLIAQKDHGIEQNICIIDPL